MKNEQTMVLDYRQVPLKIIFKGIKGETKDYTMKLSADKCGILLN